MSRSRLVVLASEVALATVVVSSLALAQPGGAQQDTNYARDH